MKSMDELIEERKQLVTLEKPYTCHRMRNWRNLVICQKLERRYTVKKYTVRLFNSMWETWYMRHFSSIKEANAFIVPRLNMYHYTQLERLTPAYPMPYFGLF